MKAAPTNKSSILRPYIIGIAIGICLSIALYLGYLGVVRGIEQISHSNASSNSQNTLSRHFEASNQNDSIDLFTDPSVDLTQLSRYESDFERSAALYRILSNASVKELVQLLEDSEKVPMENQRTNIQVDIFRRLTALDSKRALQQLNRYPTHEQVDVVPGIFRELSLLDLNAAIDGAKTLDRSVRVVALQTILEQRSELSEAQLRDIARQIENENFALHWISERNSNDLVDEPERAWIELAADSVSDALQLNSFIAIARNWIDRDGLNVLSRIEEISPESQDFSFRSNLIVAVAEDNPKSVLDYLAESPSQDHSFRLQPVLKQWVKSDPEAAFEALYSLQKSPDFSYLESAVVKAWVRHDPDELTVWIDTLSRDGRLAAIEEAVASLARTSPEQALHLMDSVSDKVESTSTVAIRLAQEWAQSDPKGAMTWALSDSQAQNPRRIDVIDAVIRKLVQIDFQHAMRVALAQPVERGGSQLEKTVIVELSRVDIESTIGLLEQVREESRLFASTWVASQLVKAGNPMRGLSVVKQLPEEHRSYGFFEVAYDWAVQDSQQMLESLVNLESDEIKSLFARVLLVRQLSKPTLTKDEIEHATSFLNEKDAEEVRRRTAQ